MPQSNTGKLADQLDTVQSNTQSQGTSGEQSQHHLLKT